jgi:3-phosphoshikimate 1-carboxyvinyltransferase
MIDALQSMGAAIEINYRQEQAGEPVGDLIVRHSPITAVDVAGDLVVRMIDEFPAFTAAAAYAHGTTSVRQAEELRLKETDRITSVVREFTGLGLKMVEKRDGFTIHGDQAPRGGTASPHGDHRLAMALAVTGLGAQGPTVVTQAEIIDESFPEFVDTLKSLGADVEMR